MKGVGLTAPFCATAALGGPFGAAGWGLWRVREKPARSDTDPLSYTAGFQMRRSLLFVSWDAGDFGSVGSTEWLEASGACLCVWGNGGKEGCAGNPPIRCAPPNPHHIHVCLSTAHKTDPLIRGPQERGQGGCASQLPHKGSLDSEAPHFYPPFLKPRLVSAGLPHNAAPEGRCVHQSGQCGPG